MALRDLLARFRIVVDRRQLDAAQQKITQTKAALKQLNSVGKLRPLQLDTAGLQKYGTAADQAELQMKQLKQSMQALSATRVAVRTEGLRPETLTKFNQASKVVRQQLAAVKRQMRQLSGTKVQSTGLKKLEQTAKMLAVSLQRTEGSLKRAGNAAAQAGAKGAAASSSNQKVSSSAQSAAAAEDKLEKELRQAGNAAQKNAGKMRQASGATKGLAKIANFAKGALGGMVAAAGINFAATFITDSLKAADAIGKTSKQLGITTDDVQIWNMVAEEGGASAAEMQTGFQKLAKNMSEGGARASEAFQSIGFEAKDSEGNLKPLGQAMGEIGGLLGGMENDTERVAAAQQILGKAGAKLIPAFGKGGEAMQKQLDSLKELAVAYDADFIANSEAANDEMGRASKQFEKLKVMLVAFLLPAIRGLAQTLTPIINSFAKWAKQSGFAERALKIIAGGGLLLLISKMGGFLKVLRLANLAMLKFIIPFLILEDLLAFLDGRDSIIGRILEKLIGAENAKKIAEGIREAWKSLVAIFKMVFAAMTGNDAAFDEAEEQFLVASTKVERIFTELGNKLRTWFKEKLTGWAQAGLMILLTIVTGGLAGLIAAWFIWGDDIKAFFAGLWNSISGGVMNFIGIVMGLFQWWVGSISSTIDFVMSLFSGLWEGLSGGFQGMVDGISGMFSGIVTAVQNAITQALALAKQIPGQVGDIISSIPGASLLMSAEGGDGGGGGGALPAIQPTVPGGGGDKSITVIDNSNISNTINAPSGDTAALGRAVSAQGNQTRRTLQKSKAATAGQLGVSQ